MAVQEFAIGDRVRHRADTEIEAPGTVAGFREEDGWVKVSWDSGQSMHHPDVNLVLTDL